MPTIGDQHIVKSYDDELKRLHDALARMAGLAEAQLAAAIEALDKRDSDIATRVMNDDPKVDECEHFINEQTVRLLALRAPVADDLRMVISALKAAGDIERIADHAANAAKRSLVLNQMPPVAPMRSLVRMGKLVAELLNEVLDAFLAHDAERALAVRSRDQEVDDLYSSLFREILTYMMEDPRTITACSHLMFIAKNIERVGDHATNIAEMTYFIATGRSLNDQRPKRDTSAYEDGTSPV
ncbi:transcriptional repressor for high-affinity phosphate uptake [Magnetospirillum gryphiswaldense MSR-1 v2]|uniref:Phosphate-specific transport system accessory protein PhoU n=1 Tax=Magnetospirillum gryphiswaldense (strain DSM 6361 / JCM 21280 / NBRC 15271 / MSR-1) TaxID=431944 RepID=A4UHR3_MAGGM|nr:phosphate signaling complex protein PhoU [Magnetospirillum gryphiswaldense]ABO69542.1 PhoU [Magnetospirillum gryphiswaldense MSR-1]CDK98111.1 transcriptional repressor for high-affinity phosphate uptake [Magnetospirillum gryphiswaldense MSR-1 v2]